MRFFFACEKSSTPSEERGGGHERPKRTSAGNADFKAGQTSKHLNK